MPQMLTQAHHCMRQTSHPEVHASFLLSRTWSQTASLEESLGESLEVMQSECRARVWSGQAGQGHGWSSGTLCCLVCVTHKTLTWQQKKWPYSFYGRSLHSVKNNKVHMKKCYQMNNNRIASLLLFDTESYMFPGLEVATTLSQSLRKLEVHIDTAVLGLASCSTDNLPYLLKFLLIFLDW